MSYVARDMDHVHPVAIRMTLQRHEFAGEGALLAAKGVHRNTFNSEIIESKQDNSAVF
jgi:hypothetical protein